MIILNRMINFKLQPNPITEHLLFSHEMTHFPKRFPKTFKGNFLKGYYYCILI